MRHERSTLVVDVGVLAFALWTLGCHAIVLLHGNGNQLLALAIGVVALACAAVGVPRLRALAREALASLLSSARILPDDALDGRARLVGFVWVASCGLVYALTGDPWVTWFLCSAYALVAAIWLLSRPCTTPVDASTDPSGQAPTDTREWLVWLCAAFAACITLLLHRDNTDDSFYVNVAVAVVDFPRDVLFGRNTLHGLPEPPPAMYHVASFELLAGTLSRITGIPALYVVHLVLGTLGGAAIPLALARLFRVLEPRRWPWMLVFALTLYLFDGSTQFGFSMHGFARIYQGKAILWSVMVPITAAYAIAFGQAPTRARFAFLVAAQIAGIGLSSTGLWLMPLTALIGACVPLTWNRQALVVFGCALAGTAYDVAAALWVRAHLIKTGADAAVQAIARNVQGPSFDLIIRALYQVLGGAPLLYYVAMLLLAPVLAHNRLLRRYLVAFGVVGLVIMLNPFLFAFLRKNLFGGSTFDRALWIMPLPAALATCAAALIPEQLDAPRARRILGTAAGALALAAFYVFVPPRTNMPPNHLRFPPGPKVLVSEYEVTKLLTKSLPQGSFVVASRSIAVHLPLVHHALYPVIAKENFFSGVEQKRRLALRDAVVSKGEAITGERATWLRAELDHYRVAGIAMTEFAARKRGLVPTLRKAGFTQLGHIGNYMVYSRKLSRAPQAAR